MHLHRLPNELLQNIAFLVVAHNPLGPPASLIPLLTSSKRIYAALLSSSAALKARIFRLKFDTSATSRRLFSPYDIHLAEQLPYYCQLLRVIKSKDVHVPDIQMILFEVYVMMLDNDGKNFAQLEWAGVTEYIDKFIRLRLWEGRNDGANAGWPLSSLSNRFALWLAWLTMDRFVLFKEQAQARDEFITLIFPFTLLSPRYPSTEAPPNHFHLPLLPESPAYQRPLVSSSNMHLPPYPNYTPHPTMSLSYFGSMQTISPPLLSIAAKLLFTVRKETSPITIPPVLPQGLHIDDYAEFNKGKAAEVVRGARWDWDRGYAVAVNPKRLRNAFRPRTREEFEEFELSIRNEVEVIADGDEESRRWDEEWWRRLLCGNLKLHRSIFPPGLVYKPGRLNGTWQGRLYMPLAEALHSALETHPHYPGYPTPETAGNGFPTFSEASTSLVMLPVFFNIQEHHKICHCPSYHLRGTEDVPYIHQKACGTIPVPLPSLYPPRYMRWRGMRPHMVVVPPEEVEAEAEAEVEEPEENNGLEGIEQPPTAEPADEPAPSETDSQVPLVFGVPSIEHGTIEEDPAVPALTAVVGLENPNTNANAYASVAPGPAFPANVDITANTTDSQPAVQTALPAPIALPQPATLATGSAPGFHLATHMGTHGQGHSHPTPVPAVQGPPVQSAAGSDNQAQQAPPDMMTFISQRLDRERQTNPRLPRLIPTHVDYAMNNGYFPGDVVPSLMFVKRRAAGAGNSRLGGKRDEIVFGFREFGTGSYAAQTAQATQMEWKMADGKCISEKGEKEVDPASGESRGKMKEESGQKQRQLYVYETYDPDKESAHDASKCKTCKEWEEVKKSERRRQDEACERKLERRAEKEESRRKKGKEKQKADELETRMLEEYMKDYGGRAGVDAPWLMDFESLDSKFGKEFLGAVVDTAAKAAAVDPSLAGLCEPVSVAVSEPSDSDSESDSSDDGSSWYTVSDSEGDQHPRRPQQTRRQRIFGEGLPLYDAKTSAGRPVFDRTRVGAPEKCCGGVRDIVITGETPRRHIAWHRQKYRLYGRVRPWDGMIGLLRVDERSMPGYSSGLQHLGEGLEESEYWSVITNMFICGYIVGGRTFVGEWRMAASDPLKPGWSGPVVMSLREQEDGEETIWEPVGGSPI